MAAKRSRGEDNESKSQPAFLLNLRPLPRDISPEIASFLALDDLGAFAFASHSQQDLVCSLFARVDVLRGRVSANRRPLMFHALGLLSGVLLVAFLAVHRCLAEVAAPARLRDIELHFRPVSRENELLVISRCIEKHQSTLQRVVLPRKIMQFSVVVNALVRCEKVTTFDIASNFAQSQAGWLCGVLSRRPKLTSLSVAGDVPTDSLCRVLKAGEPLCASALSSAHCACSSARTFVVGHRRR